MSVYELLIILLILIFSVAGFGGCAGYEVAGVPQGGAVESPGIFAMLDWSWEALEFLFYMTTFQVDDMPVFISTIFVIMGLLTIFIIIRMVRGVS